MAHPLSLSYLTVFDITPLEAISVAEQAGYDMIGLRLLPAGATEDQHKIFTDQAYFNEVLARLNNSNLTVADVEIVRLNEHYTDDKFRSFVEKAQQLGAKNVLVAGDDPEKHRLTESYAKFCQLAHAHGLTADLEFMPWTQVPNLSFAQDLVKAANQPNAGILIDGLHMDRAKVTLDEIKSLPTKYINYVQLCDGHADYDPSVEGLIHVARNERLDPGEGDIDLIGLVRSIPANTVLSVEVPKVELAKTTTPLYRAQKAIDAAREVIAKAYA